MRQATQRVIVVCAAGVTLVDLEQHLLVLPACSLATCNLQ